MAFLLRRLQLRWAGTPIHPQMPFSFLPIFVPCISSFLLLPPWVPVPISGSIQNIPRIFFSPCLCIFSLPATWQLIVSFISVALIEQPNQKQLKEMSIYLAYRFMVLWKLRQKLKQLVAAHLQLRTKMLSSSVSVCSYVVFSTFLKPRSPCLGIGTIHQELVSSHLLTTSATPIDISTGQFTYTVS